jgi:tetratricopeptide (TPR) repeat protein
MALVLAAGLSAGLQPALAAVDADVLARAEALLAQQQPGECRALLLPLLATGAGDTRLQYLFGVCAQESGHALDAVDAFTRLLEIEPRFDGARLELARSLQAAGRFDAARAQYSRLLAPGASALTQDAATRGLAALERAAAAAAAGTAPDAAAPVGAAPAPPAAPASRWIPALAVGAGYDTNANASTSDSTFFGITLSPTETARASSYGEFDAALQNERALGSGMGLASSISAGHRANPSAHFTDEDVVTANSTLTVDRFGWLASLGAAASWIWFDGRSYLASGYAEVSLAHRLGKGWEITGLARAGVLDYRQAAYRALDINRYLWGGAVQRVDLGGGRGRLGLALIGGRDDARDIASPFSNDRYGARLFGSWQAGPNASFYGEISWLTADFFGSRGFLGIDRLDRQYVAVAAFELRDWPAKNWRLAPQLRATDNPSNVGVFRFDRIEASLFLRREFR